MAYFDKCIYALAELFCLYNVQSRDHTPILVHFDVK